MAAPPLESLEKIDVRGHVAFPCRNARERPEVAVPLPRPGLARGEKIPLCRAPRRGDEILRAIGGAGIDIGSSFAGGIALQDIVMPKMGGKETFEALREISPSLPVLLSSGYTLEGVAQEILDKGANGFIQKPYGLSELARAVRGILGARAGR